MELRHLRYFVAVAELKGFREASRFLHVSQPAISSGTVADAAGLPVSLHLRTAQLIFFSESVDHHGDDGCGHAQAADAERST